MKLKEWIRKILKCFLHRMVLPVLYWWYSRGAVDEKLVLFADHRDRSTPDNFLSLLELCRENGYRCVVFSGRDFGEHLPKWTQRRERLKFQLRFMRQFARCRALFLVEYFPLAYLVKVRPETDVVQLWHGCGAMKKFGYSAVGKNWGLTQEELRKYPMHTNYTLACVSGEKAMEPFRDAFRCAPKVVQAIGVPRTDVYFRGEFREAAVRKVRERFPQIGERQIILYAPTFRGVSMAKSYLDFRLDIPSMAQALSDRYALILKFHPLMGSPLTDDACLRSDFVFDGSKVLTPEEALCAADVLITDYSSIMFEYLLLERPVISYVYDIDEYDRDRGMYYPYEELSPGPCVRTQEELLAALQALPESFDPEKTRRYAAAFMGACDGASTQRIFDHVFRKTERSADRGEMQ